MLNFVRLVRNPVMRLDFSAGVKVRCDVNATKFDVTCVSFAELRNLICECTRLSPNKRPFASRFEFRV